MSDYAANSEIVGRDAPLVQQYFRYLYDSGHDTPIDKAVKLLCDLASGRADALSGCFLDVDDDLNELINALMKFGRMGSFVSGLSNRMVQPIESVQSAQLSDLNRFAVGRP